jgi:hypothetical protein
MSLFLILSYLFPVSLAALVAIDVPPTDARALAPLKIATLRGRR